MKIDKLYVIPAVLSATWALAAGATLGSMAGFPFDHDVSKDSEPAIEILVTPTEEQLLELERRSQPVIELDPEMTVN